MHYGLFGFARPQGVKSLTVTGLPEEYRAILERPKNPEDVAQEDMGATESPHEGTLYESRG